MRTRRTWTMDRWATTALLFAVLLTQQLVVCNWTFSLRVSTGRCCNSLGCEQISSCDDVAVGICLRNPDTSLEDLQSCSFLFTGSGSDIIGTLLTPDYDNTGSGDIINTGYQGGIQIFTGVTTVPEFPPFDEVASSIDTIFITVDTRQGSGEVSVTGEGKNGRANLTFSFTVECSPGYGGDDCLTVNTCSEETTCNLTLGYCNTAGECVCHDGITQCTTGTTVEPSTSSTSDTDLGPIIAGVVVAVAILAIIIIIIVVAIIVLFYKRKEKRKAEEIVLTGPLDNSPASTIEPPSSETPLYSTINKEKKRRRIPPEIPAPYQVPLSERDSGTITTSQPSDPTTGSHEGETTGKHGGETTGNHGGEETSNGTGASSSNNTGKGLVYAELDLHTAKTAPPKPPRPPDTSFPQPSSNEEQPVTYSTVHNSPYSNPRTPPQPANPGDVEYFTIPTTN